MSIKGSSIYLLVLILLGGIVFSACQPSEPDVVEKLVTQVIKETVVVEGTPQVVEKEITVVVQEEVEKEVTRVVEVVVTPEETMEEGPLPAPEGDQVVDIIAALGEGQSVQPWYVQITEEYEELFPNVDIQWDWAGSDYAQKARTRMAAGDPPDAFWGNTSMTESTAPEGILLRLDEYFETLNFEGTETWKDTFLEGILDQLAYIEDGGMGSGIYAVPVEYHVMGIFYVNKRFEEAGITNVPVEWTWQEFLDINQQLLDAGIEPIAQDNFSWYTGWWYEFIAGQIAGQDVYYNTAMNMPGTSWVDNPDFLKAATLEEDDLIKSGYLIEGYEGSQYPAGQMELTTGRAAMILNGAWIGSELKDNFAADEELIVNFFPVIEGNGTGPVVEAKYNGWHIPKDAKHVDATIHFLKYLTSRSIQERKVVESANAGILKGLDTPKHAKNQDYMLDNAQVIVGMHHDLMGAAPDWVTTVFHPVHDRFFLGEISAEEFIQELQEAHEAYWATKEE